MTIKNFNFVWHWHLLRQRFVAFLEFVHDNAIISSETARCEDVIDDLIFKFS